MPKIEYICITAKRDAEGIIKLKNTDKYRHFISQEDVSGKPLTYRQTGKTHFKSTDKYPIIPKKLSKNVNLLLQYDYLSANTPCFLHYFSINGGEIDPIIADI